MGRVMSKPLVPSAVPVFLLFLFLKKNKGTSVLFTICLKKFSEKKDFQLSSSLSLRIMRSA